MEQKKIKLEHVLYEIWMYLATYHRMLADTNLDSEDKLIIHNALWESHLIHLRAMLYFFESKELDKDTRNIYVEDIVTNGTQYTFPGNNFYLKNDLSQTLAHLSCKRTNINKMNLGKEVYDIYMTLRPVIFDFISSIDVNIKENLKKDLIENQVLVQKIKNEYQ